MATSSKSSAKGTSKRETKSPAAGPLKVKKVPAVPPKQPAAAPKPVEAQESSKKAKLVRDSFTMPKSEYAAIEVLKQRALAAGVSVKKSEVLRAGIKALAGMHDAAYLSALKAVPVIKTGRPTKSTKAN